MTLLLKNLDAEKREAKAAKFDKIAGMIEDDAEWYMDSDVPSIDIVEALYFAAEQLRGTTSPAPQKPAAHEPE